MVWKLLKNYLFVGVFILSFSIFLAHTAYTRTAIFSDARFYYAITRSIVKDFDIKFANEFEKLEVVPTYTHGDYVWNKYPPGVSFFWIPLFIITDGFVQIIKYLGFAVEASGFGLIYEISAATTSIFLGVLGLYFVYRLLKDYFAPTLSTLTTMALFATTNLLFYIAVESVNSHSASFFVSSIFTYYFLRNRKDRKYYFILGLIAGLAGLIRTQDALILALPIIQNFAAKTKNLKLLIANCYLLFAGFFSTFFPQIIFWKVIFNTWLSPYIEEGFNLLNPQILYVAFNLQNGLFTITPIVGISFLGLFVLLRKSKILGIYALVYFLLQLYLVSSWSGFYQGGSYSIRMMITTYPLLSFGLAQVIERLLQRMGKVWALIIILVFAGLNNILVIRYLLLF